MPRSFYSCNFVFYPVHCVYYEMESLISLTFLQWVVLALSTHLAVSISRYTREQMCLFGRISDTSSVLFIFLSLSWVMLFAHCPTHTLFRHQPATCGVYKQYQGSPSWGLFLLGYPPHFPGAVATTGSVSIRPETQNMSCIDVLVTPFMSMFRIQEIYSMLVHSSKFWLPFKICLCSLPELSGS